MQELKKKTSDRVEKQSGRSVTLFMESQFIVLSGHWDWELNTDLVFCSDVILSFHFEFSGTKALIHPEDKAMLHNKIFTGQELNDVEFRVITTYGEIKILSGNNLSLALDDNTVLSWHEEILRKLEEDRDLPHLQILQELYHNTEIDLKAGTWYHNKSTNETWYSAQVFRIFDLAPHSLNPNLNTFNPFIHTEEKDTFSEYFHQAYKKQAPFHIDFRIQTSRAEKKVRLLMHWIYSPAGEPICCGTYQDISEQKSWEDIAVRNDEKAELNRQILAMEENNGGLGHWNINLLTKKVVFSDNLFRIFGLKPHSVPPVMTSLYNYVHPSDRELFEKNNRTVFQTHANSNIEFRIIRTDNKTRHLQQKTRIISIGEELMMCGIIQDITVQKLLEKKVQALVEWNHLKSAVRKQEKEISRTGSWEWNLNTGKIEWSDSIFSLLGIKTSTSEFSWKQLMVYIHCEDQKKFLDSVALVTKEKKEPEFNFRMVIRGKVYFFKAFFRIYQDGQKEIFIGTIQDQTLYHVLQKEINEKLQVTEAISENLEDKVIIIDQDNRVVLWNRKSEIGFGIKKEQAQGKNIFDLLPRFKTEEILAYYDRVWKGETITVNDLKVLPRGNFQVKLVPLWKEFASEVTGIIHLIHDVTRENELRKNLNERLSFIENIVESSVDQIIALDKNLNFVIWNKQCEKQYGLSKEEVVGKNILDIFPSSKNAPAFEDFRKALRGEKVHIPAQPGLGKEQYNEVYLLPVKNEREEIIAVLWILHDLSKEYDLNLQRTKVNSILESLNEGYFELDQDLYFIKVNKVSEDFFHKNKEDMLGKKFTDVFPHASREVVATMNKTLQTGLPHRGEFYSTITDRWVYISINSTEEGIAVVFFDLQRIKDAEKLVQENEYLLQQINKATPDAITIYNIIDKQPIYLNNALSEWTGISSEELIAMGQEGRIQLIHPDERNLLLEFNTRLATAKDKEVNTLDYRIVSNGKTLWIRNRSKVFKRNTDGVATHFLTILQDITREKELLKKLEERSRYAESIINSSVDQIIVLDTNFNVIAINEKSESILNLRKEEAIGKNFFAIFPKLKEEPVIWKAFEDARQGKLVQLSPRKAIYSDNINERIYLPLKNELGEVYAIVNVVHDVTELINKSEELKELNKILAIRNKELQQKNEEITNFSFVASHDMKEPLRKIYTFSDWILENERENLSSTGIDFLNRLQSSVKRMERLIDDIQVLMKVHSDTQHFQEVNLSEVIEEVIKDLEETYTDFETEVSSMPGIVANRNQLFLLCRNLIQNSIKFRNPGTKARIRISSILMSGEKSPGIENPAEKYLRLSFADKGTGINEKYFIKIFQVFQQLSGDDVLSGTGMGLAICRKIMENHGGYIRLESEEGKGTVFHCYFPVT